MSSEEKLFKLVQERINNPSDKKLIDEKIWELFGEDWAIMFTDLSGFSRNSAKFGIIHFLQTIYESKIICEPIIDKNDGFLLKTEGDSMLVIFRKPEKALKASIEMQLSLIEYNKHKIEEEKVLLCVGLGFGRILKIGDKDVFGEEVNFASKLGEDTAKAYDILVTKNFKDNCNTISEYELEEKEKIFELKDIHYKVLFKN
ncbi:MAG: adenylate/guanylate cyclase domain-containing protein [Candidatus Sericytochromatia bacterium]